MSEAGDRGFVSPAMERRYRARQAGKASGRARAARAAGRRVGHQRDRAGGLAVAYPVQHITRAKFAERFAALRTAEDKLVSERGLETAWQEYRSCRRCYYACGQDFKTTNGQRSRALELAGRKRCSRTVQRVHHDLAAMGLLQRSHIHRGRAAVGNKDCIRVRLTPSFVTPPTAAPTAERSSAVVGASTTLDSHTESVRNGSGGAAGARREPPSADGGADGIEERQDRVAGQAGEQQGSERDRSNAAEISALRWHLEHPEERVKRGWHATDAAICERIQALLDRRQRE